MPDLVPNFLSIAQRAAFAVHRSNMAELCSFAGRPHQAAEFITRGVTLPAAHAALVEAQAEGLPETWPLAENALAARARHRQVEDGGADPEAVSEPVAVMDADLSAALAYAAEVGSLCALAGFPERAIDALDRGVSIRLLRTELLTAKSELVPVASIDTTLGPASSPPALSASFYSEVYARRAAAMRQGDHHSKGVDRQPLPGQQPVPARTAAV